MKPSDIVKTPKGKVVKILSEAEPGHWRCDDGWVHEESQLSEASNSERVGKQSELGRALSNINEFSRWEESDR